MSEPDTDASDLRAKVFEDRITHGEWRVEKTDDDGGIEVAVFGGPNARWRAIRYGADKYGVDLARAVPVMSSSGVDPRPRRAHRVSRSWPALQPRLRLLLHVNSAAPASK
jgi:hypothetical protein